MIDIRITQNMDNCTIVIEGHAEYAERGHDIVCSAISVLYQNLIQSIDMLTSSVAHEYPQNGSQMSCISNIDDRTYTLIQSFKFGCMSVAETYPKNVKVKEV